MITRSADASPVTLFQVVASVIGTPVVLLAIYSVYTSLGGTIQIFGF